MDFEEQRWHRFHFQTNYSWSTTEINTGWDQCKWPIKSAQKEKKKCNLTDTTAHINKKNMLQERITMAKCLKCLSARELEEQVLLDTFWEIKHWNPQQLLPWPIIIFLACSPVIGSDFHLHFSQKWFSVTNCFEQPIRDRKKLSKCMGAMRPEGLWYPTLLTSGQQPYWDRRAYTRW